MFVLYKKGNKYTVTQIAEGQAGADYCKGIGAEFVGEYKTKALADEAMTQAIATGKPAGAAPGRFVVYQKAGKFTAAAVPSNQTARGYCDAINADYHSEWPTQTDADTAAVKATQSHAGSAAD